MKQVSDRTVKIIFPKYGVGDIKEKVTQEIEEELMCD
jgi:hypothetical protein